MRRIHRKQHGGNDGPDAAPIETNNVKPNLETPTAEQIAMEAARTRKLSLPVNYDIMHPLYPNSTGPAKAHVKKTLILRNRNY